LHTDAGHGNWCASTKRPAICRKRNGIIEEAKSLIAEGAARSDIAVLYRSNAQSRVIEHALFSSGIPYRVYGGQRFL